MARVLPRKVLITGGAGFIGKALLSARDRWGWNCEFTIYSRDELKQQLCKRKYPEARYVLGDVCNVDALELVMAGHDVVIHAAAQKYVPEAEHNVLECIRTNVDGSRAVISAAIRSGVPRVVGISTDKACEPVNTYGMTKALMERMFSEADGISPQTRFSVVRYGNVIGSVGSVIPHFRRLARETGKIELTDPTMTRFWMSVHQAVALIVFGATFSLTGHTFIHEAKSMDMFSLSGYVAPDATIDIVGARPGEKKHEALYGSSECPWTIALPVPHYVALLPPPLRKGDPPNSRAAPYTSDKAPMLDYEELMDAVLDAEALE